jgi:uncharacterized OsmC-like protein
MGASYHVDVVNGGSSLFEVKSKDGHFTFDTNGKGMTPPDVLLAGLGTCFGVYVRKYCEGAKIPLEGFSISVDADFVKERPICFRQIRISVDLGGITLDEHRRSSLLEFVKNCPVHNTLKSNPDVVVNIL